MDLARTLARTPPRSSRGSLLMPPPPPLNPGRLKQPTAVAGRSTTAPVAPAQQRVGQFQQLIAPPPRPPAHPATELAQPVQLLRGHAPASLAGQVHTVHHGQRRRFEAS